MSLQVIEWQDFLGNYLLTESKLKSAMTIGVFDGVHLGHVELLKRVVKRGPNPTVISFRNNPRKLISPGGYEGDIFSLKQKLKVFESLGLRRLVLIDFSENFSKLNGWEFLDLLEERGKMVYLAIGANFRCGFNQNTDADFIREMNERKGIPTDILPPVIAGGRPVSSSRIRSAILSGDLECAAALMGRNVELDLSDIKNEGPVYEPAQVQRIVPADGQYPVIVSPGRIPDRVLIEKGKVILSGTPWAGDKQNNRRGTQDLPGLGESNQAESLEFIQE